ncbi:hypothetical protein F383_31791 [Gossypium arboreum]|uniref:Uncharacterized protein n=1 Tax=Gossypium arboreum TaxID=29729 RepID=A0A0B0N2U4_GOSAR|nr:hypothetical protein F383_31791 [Gossypium arboreum]
MLTHSVPFHIIVTFPFQ